MTMLEIERYRVLKRTHQLLLREWRRDRRACIVCAEREGDKADHLPPKVLFPSAVRAPETEFFTFPVCLSCNGASTDDDFLFSVLLTFGLCQEDILAGREPTDPDLLALYRQAQGHFEDPKESARRRSLLQRFTEDDPWTGLPAIDVRRVPLNRTLTKIVKSIYWLHTGGDILQRYDPAWWVLGNVDTSKNHFVTDHLRTTHAEMHWGDRFIYHYTIGHAEDGVGGFIISSLHFYTRREAGRGMSWMVIASPSLTQVDGRSLYEISLQAWGRPTIGPKCN